MQTINFTLEQSNQILMMINSDELQIISNTLECIDNVYSFTVSDNQLNILADLLYESNDLDLITTLVKQDRNNVIQPISL